MPKSPSVHFLIRHANLGLGVSDVQRERFRGWRWLPAMLSRVKIRPKPCHVKAQRDILLSRAFGL